MDDYRLKAICNVNDILSLMFPQAYTSELEQVMRIPCLSAVHRVLTFIKSRSSLREMLFNYYNKM